VKTPPDAQRGDIGVFIEARHGHAPLLHLRLFRDGDASGSLWDNFPADIDSGFLDDLINVLKQARGHKLVQKARLRQHRKGFRQ
jgi:hypothetical protein